MQRLLAITLILAPLGCAASTVAPASPQPPEQERAATAEASPAAAEQGQQNVANAGTSPADMAMACPMGVQGTTSSAEDPQGGAALSFKTTGDVVELRHRVARMAEMHNQGGGMMGGKQGGMMGGKQGGMMGGGMMGDGKPGGMQGGMMGGSKQGGMMGDGKSGDKQGGMMGGGKSGDKQGGMMGGGMQGGMMGGGMMMPPSKAESVEVDGGARLVFTPRDPADLAKLREHVHQRAEQMASGKCPMMQMHAQSGESSSGGDAASP